MSRRIGVITGSLRRDAYTKQIAEYLINSAPEGIELSIIDISDLPLYNQDFDESPDEPLSYARFREEVASKDGFIFVTPEYNRSIPAALKNALDIASRPSGKNVWSGKPAAVISASPSAIGGFGASHHLRQVAVVLNMPVVALPEMYISHVADAFDGSGNIADERLKSLFEKFLEAYSKWIERF